jgi:hypothetical protein
LPASKDAKKSREIFLKILTMDDAGAWDRCKPAVQRKTSRASVSAPLAKAIGGSSKDLSSGMGIRARCIYGGCGGFKYGNNKKEGQFPDSALSFWGLFCPVGSVKYSVRDRRFTLVQGSTGTAAARAGYFSGILVEYTGLDHPTRHS